MPKKEYSGICAIDPSWKGFAIALYIPVLGIETTFCYSLTDGSKSFKTPRKTMENVLLTLKDFFALVGPVLDMCDYFVVENQFKRNMQNLQYFTMCHLMSMVPNATITSMSALKVKRVFGIELQESHYLNKQKAVEYVESNQNALFCGKSGYKCDNRCDAILLLNAYLRDKRMNKTTYVQGTSNTNCSNCGTAFVVRAAGPTAKNPGRRFQTCPNSNRDNICNKQFTWMDTETIPTQTLRPETTQRTLMSTLEDMDDFVRSDIYKLLQTLSMQMSDLCNISNGMRE
jgi:hypothetical protein